MTWTLSADERTWEYRDGDKLLDSMVFDSLKLIYRDRTMMTLGREFKAAGRQIEKRHVKSTGIGDFPGPSERQRL